MDLSGLGSLGDLTSGFDSSTVDVYTKNKLENKNFGESLLKAQETGDDSKLKDACVEFESYFIKMMFSSMRSSVNTEDSFLPKNNGEKIFQDMLDEEYAAKAANSGNGIGLAKVLYKQLSANLKKPDGIE